MILPQFEYCESVSGFLFDQPLNVISNLAFFVVAAGLFKLGHQRTTVILAAVIGVGSCIWHITMQPYGLALDIGSIAVFMAYEGTLFLRRHLNLIPSIAGAAMVSVLVIAALFKGFWPSVFLQSTGAFLPIVGFLVALAFLTKTANKAYLLSAAGFLSAAMVFRIIDMPLCDTIPFGTHFLWHIFAAITLYFFVRSGAEQNQSRPRS